MTIDVRFVSATSYKDKMQSVCQEFESYVISVFSDIQSASKKYKASIKGKYLSDDTVEYVDAKELTTNDYLRNKIVTEAEKLGYIVHTNKSSILPDRTSSSRFYSSRPDLSILNPSSHCGFTVIVVNQMSSSSLHQHQRVNFHNFWVIWRR